MLLKYLISDIIIGTSLIQHDIDASPFTPRFHVPLLDICEIETDKDISKKAYKAALDFTNNKDIFSQTNKILSELNIGTPQVLMGTIATGDQFNMSLEKKTLLTDTFKNLKCVEMEGAAVAQVCYEYKIPFSVIRIISDNSDKNAHYDIQKFFKLAGFFSSEIIKNLLPMLNNA